MLGETDMQVKFFFAWYDFWIGAFYDQSKQILYLCPLPCCVVKIQKKSVRRCPVCQGEMTPNEVLVSIEGTGQFACWDCASAA